MPATRMRFAPSPTGYLHVGGARTALFNWLLARKHAGVFLLRIEDTDASRSSTEMIEGILEGMRWLGLDWDEGPFLQSKRLDLYTKYAELLLRSGNAYFCYCAPNALAAKREEAERQNRPWKYDRTCRGLAPERIQESEGAARPRAVRFKVPDGGSTAFDDAVFGSLQTQHEEIEDFVLLRSDGKPTYHLSVVVDDIEMGISQVIRGADHLSNTPKQILIYRALGRPVPSFAHLPLILGADRQRLSKRHGATSVTAYRDQGYLPEAFVNFLALLGWSPGTDRELMGRDELVRSFSLEGISKANAVFDAKKLDWFNSQYLSQATAERLSVPVREELRKVSLWREEYEGAARPWFLATLDLLKSRMGRISDFVQFGRPFFTDDFSYDPEAVEKYLKETVVLEALAELGGRLRRLERFDLESTEEVLRRLAEERGLKAGALIGAVRVALTGRSVAPGIFQVLVTLGRERCLARLTRMREYVHAHRAGCLR